MTAMQQAFVAPVLIVIGCIGHLLMRRLFFNNPDPHPLRRPLEEHLWVIGAVGLIGFCVWVMFK